MNKTKRPMNNRLAKKNKKEVHSARGRNANAKLADELTEKELKKRYPTRKTAKQTKTVKHPVAPKKKVGTKLSKRTTSGTVEATSSPASIHREGAVWNKTLVKQSLNKRKTLSKKLSKRK
jgi:hypothetical protein